MQARPGLADAVDWRLYVVTDTSLSGGPDRVPHIVSEAVRGGAGVIQVRDKHLDDADFLTLTRACVEANEHAFDTTGRRAAIVVNDRLAVAAELGLHLHLGQDDGDVRAARRALGTEVLIGLSISSEAELETELADQTADALGLSPIWATPTKTDAAEPLGLDGASSMVQAVAGRAKTLAIGGVSLSNASQVIDSGVDGLCVVSAIATAVDPRRTAEQFISMWRTR